MNPFEKQLQALGPKDRAAVKAGKKYRLVYPGQRVEYADSLQDAIARRGNKQGEEQASITALPWKRSPAVTP